MRSRKPSVDTIKAIYPEPTKSTPYYKEGDYCVGGALFLYTGENNHFPLNGELAGKLLHTNPELSLETALPFASSIITHNDSYEFSEAWSVLSQALEYRRES